MIFFIIHFFLVISAPAKAEQVGIRVDLQKRKLSMIVVDSEFQDAMAKVVKIMQAAETVTKRSPDSKKDTTLQTEEMN